MVPVTVPADAPSDPRWAMKAADQSMRSPGTKYPVSSLIVSQCVATSSMVGAWPTWTYPSVEAMNRRANRPKPAV